jgi:hypothetical protein
MLPVKSGGFSYGVLLRWVRECPCGTWYIRREEESMEASKEDGRLGGNGKNSHLWITFGELDCRDY